MKILKNIYPFLKISILEFFREPEIIFWSIIFPISTALILGIAFHRIQNKTFTIGIKESRDDSIFLIKNLKLNPNIQILVLKEEEIQEFLKKRKLYAYIEIENQKIHFFYDKHFSEAKEVYIELLKAFYHHQKSIPIIEKTIEIKGTRYIDFLVPGLIALGIMNSALWGIGWNFIQMRIKKLLKLFYISPLDQNSFFFGYIFARYVLSIIENTLLFFITNYFYDIPFHGNFFELFLFYSVSYFCFAGIAFLASSRATTTIAANGILNAISMPMIILSGIFFDYTGFPEVFVHIIELLPLTIIANTLRKIFIEGSSIVEFYVETLILLFIGNLCFLLGKKIFVWK